MNSSAHKTPSVLLVDDHAVVREGLASLLSLTGDFGTIIQAGDGAAAVTLAKTHAPDLVVIDLLMPALNGVDAIVQIHAFLPACQIAVLTSADDDGLALSAIQAGAQSFLVKSMSGDALLHALRQIITGVPVIHPDMTQSLLRAARESRTIKANPFATLTPRELEVLKALAGGASNARIAHVLHITERTVKSHIGNILSKLDLSDRTEVVAFAWRNGFMFETKPPLSSF